MFLETIEKANDIKQIDKENWGELAQEIRQFLIEKISVTGGHLGCRRIKLSGMWGTSPTRIRY